MKRGGGAGSGAEMSIPPLFRCPISLELFTDPVTLCTGQTYDRPSIQKWISSGNFTCPVTMQRLHDLSMVPNHALSHLIHLWLNQTAHTPSLVGPHPSHDDHLAALKQTLETQEPIWEKKLLALRQVKVLTLELSNRENESLIRFGFFQILIKLGFERVMAHTHQSLELVELALSSAVKLMPFGDLGCLNLLKEEPKFAAFPTLLEQGTPLVKTLVCQILEAVLSSQSQETRELASMIRNSDQIQRSIINLINGYGEDDNAEVSEAGVKVILALCSRGADHHGQRQLVQLGAIKALIRHTIRSLNREGGAVAAAVAAVEALLKVEGGKQALLGEPGGVKTLVKMVFRVNDHHGSESAVNGLMGLCSGSAEAREAAVRAGVVTQLLLLIQSQCGWRAKARAGMLLKLLRTLWTNGPSNRNHEG